MNDNEIMEKYGISKRTGIIILVQLLFVFVALVLSVFGIIKSSGMERILVYSGQAVMCGVLIVFGFVHFKKRDRQFFKFVLYSYGFLEALRAALLNTAGIDPMISGLCRFLLAILACNCVMLSERLETYNAERIAYGLIILESALYLIFLFKFPGIMNGHLNRFLPFVGILIACSIALFIKAKNEQLGVPEKVGSTVHKWQSVVITLLSLVITISALSVVSYRNKLSINNAATLPSNAEQKSRVTTTSLQDLLSDWEDDAKAKQELIAYVESVTEEGSQDFIPVEDRIAVFDFDGTLICETDPGCLVNILFIYRVLEDPEYKDKASLEEIKTAEKMREAVESGTYPKNLGSQYEKASESAFKGMSVDEYLKYVHDFSEQVSPGYLGMERREAFYVPMVQIVDYLEANDFKIYIVSTSDRNVVRAVVMDNEIISIPTEQIIGSDVTIVTQNQESEEGIDYKFSEGDVLTLGGDRYSSVIQMGKVSAIAREIGKQPVLSFGNSELDASVAEYVRTNNKYKSLSFMVCCDDNERENGNLIKADTMKSLCEQYNWIPISMKNDWKTIYGENVKKINK